MDGLKKDQAVKLLEDAWKDREYEILEIQQSKLQSLEKEHSRLSNALAEAHLRIQRLESDNADLERSIQSMKQQSVKFEQIKFSLMDSLNESEFREIPRFSNSFSNSPRKAVDNKSFYSEVRDRLSFEEFTKFLDYVKKVNSKVIPKDRAINEVRDLFGAKNSDLHRDFVSLLVRNN